MQLGIHVNTFRRPTLEETLDAAAEYGLKCVHFNMAAAGLPSMPEQIDDELCDEIREELAARDITMATLSGAFNMIHPSVDVRNAGLRRLEAVASAARRMGTSVVTLCTGTRDKDDMWTRHADNDTPESWGELIATTTQVLRIAERCDLTVAIEPDVGNVVDSAAKARRLLDEMQSPRLKVVMDAANLFHDGELARMHVMLGAAFDLLGPDVIAAHAKDLDHDGAAGKLAAGRGVLDYDFYLDQLIRIGFDGPLILHTLNEDQVEDSIEFIKGKLAELNNNDS